MAKTKLSGLNSRFRSLSNPDVVRLNEQVVLITGGSRGLGLLLAREFAKEGCKLAICARDYGELERAKADLDVFSPQTEVLIVECDVSDKFQVQNLVEAVLQRFGRIDILVNNAGVIQVGPLQNMTLENFEEAFQNDFWSVVYLTLAVLPLMQARESGQIVNISSIGGKVSIPHLLPYSAAKFATTGFSEGLAAELFQKRISVTTIIPGLMRTGSHLNAEFKGNQAAEFGWFSLGASLPLLSMDAEKAASRIILAVKRRESECILSIPANILALTHGILPGPTLKILQLVNRFVLPGVQKSSGADKIELGNEIEAKNPSTILKTLTTMGRSAAQRFNQL